MKIIIEISCDDVMDAHFIWDKEMMTKGIKKPDFLTGILNLQQPNNNCPNYV